MMTVARTLPNGTIKYYPAGTLKDAARHIAYCLADNTGMNKSEASKHAATAERTGTVSAAGYTFVIANIS